MIDPEDASDQASWPTLDFLAQKAVDDDNKRAKANTKKIESTKIQRSKSSESKQETKASSSLNDEAPKPHIPLAVKIDSSTNSPEKGSAPSKLTPKVSFSNSKEGTPRSMSRTSSISHADWCKQHSPRRSTLKIFVSAEKASKQGVGAMFIPAKFEGNKAGYIHRSGLLGSGYYLQTNEIKHIRQEMQSGASNVAPQLHPSLRGMGLSLVGMGLHTVIDDSDSDSDSSSMTNSNMGTYQSQRDMYDRVLETEQAVHTLSPAYRKQNGMGIYGPEDADWLTRRLAEQYRQEQIGHGESLAAAIHQAPTTRGDNFLWNKVNKKDEDNLSYYEKLHQTTISGSTARDSQVAGAWLAVLKSKSLDHFLPEEDSSNDDSSVMSGRSRASRAVPTKRGMGYETDWLKTPTYGVSGKDFYKNAKPMKDVLVSGTDNAQALHKALQNDTKDPRHGQHYVTHKTGMARACKGSNSAWNTQEAKGCQKSWNRGFRNPKPQRLVRGLDKNRCILQQFLSEPKNNRESPQQKKPYETKKFSTSPGSSIQRLNSEFN